MKAFLTFLCDLLIGIIMWPFVIIAGAIALATWPILWAINGWDGQI